MENCCGGEVDRKMGGKLIITIEWNCEKLRILLEINKILHILQNWKNVSNIFKFDEYFELVNFKKQKFNKNQAIFKIWQFFKILANSDIYLKFG